MSLFSDETTTGPEFRNVATGDSTVGAQAGVIHYLNIYQTSEEQTTAQRLETGIRRLESGNPREAEAVLADVVLDGHADSRAAYYWALSILRGRTSDQLDEVHFRNLEHACRCASAGADDSWARGLQLVEALLGLLLSGPVDGEESYRHGEVLKAYDALDSERAAEVRRHLDHVLDGVLLEHIYRENVLEAEKGRMSHGRIERAWKFFEPEPVRPERVLPPPGPSPLAGWLKLLAAMVVVLAAARPLASLLVEGGISVLAGLAAGATGVVQLARARSRRQSVRATREAEQRRFSVPQVDGRPWNYRKEAPFFNSVTSSEFGKVAPTDKEEKAQWKQETEGYRLNLTREFAAYQNPAVHSKQSKLRWLARWHAERLAREWNEAEVDEQTVPGGSRQTASGSVRNHLQEVAAFGLTVAGAVLCWWPMWTNGGIAHYLALPMVVLAGIRVAYDQGCGLIESARSQAMALDKCERRHQDELAAYRDWCEELQDKPSDIEMARWLDYDKRYLRFRAMELCGVGNPDVVAHVTLPRPNKQPWAKLPGGPKRYSSYFMTVILMTKSGVRLSRFHLEVPSGEVAALERHSFRYDAIASVHVTHVPVRQGQATEPVVEQSDGKTETTLSKHTDRQRYRATFRIVLFNQERPIDTPLDIEDEVQDDQEESHELIQRAIQVPGVSGALRMMEGISGDGKEWLQAEENRRRRRQRTRPSTSD